MIRQVACRNRACEPAHIGDRGFVQAPHAREKYATKRWLRAKGPQGCEPRTHRLSVLVRQPPDEWGSLPLWLVLQENHRPPSMRRRREESRNLPIPIVR